MCIVFLKIGSVGGLVAWCEEGERKLFGVDESFAELDRKGKRGGVEEFVGWDLRQREAGQEPKSAKLPK